MVHCLSGCLCGVIHYVYEGDHVLLEIFETPNCRLVLEIPRKDRNTQMGMQGWASVVGSLALTSAAVWVAYDGNKDAFNIWIPLMIGFQVAIMPGIARALDELSNIRVKPRPAPPPQVEHGDVRDDGVSVH